MGSTNGYSQEQQQMARSYSFELRRNNCTIPSTETTSSAVRYPSAQPRTNLVEKPLRSSSVNVLMNSSMIGSRASLPIRKVLKNVLMRSHRVICHRYSYKRNSF